jgi:muramidase (phage lysozyme)
MTPAQALLLTSSALLLVAASRTQGQIEAAEGELSLNIGGVSDTLEAGLYRLTEKSAMVDSNTAARNLRAFMDMIARCEGTAGRGDYRCVYGYRMTLANLSDHPANTGEWRGEKLSDAMCRGAGFGPGCISTAAGRYQITRGTWREFGGVAEFGSFSEAGQDACCAAILAKHGALEDAKAGRVLQAAHKVRGRWASLPGNTAGQGKRTPAEVLAYYQQSGGTLA